MEKEFTPIQNNALEIVEKLKDQRKERERKYPPSIQAVLVFSGPGTYRDRLKPEQEEYMRWMDRDRIRAGVAVVREISASIKSEKSQRTVKSKDISPDDIREFGPFLVYNGIPTENEVFRQTLQTEPAKRKLPQEKTLIIDEVNTPNSTHPIRHTGDQYESFFHELRNPSSPLFGIENVALVAHAPDFVRHPFYAKKYNDQHVKNGGNSINFYPYALKSRSETESPHLEGELERLAVYSERGDLETTPVEFNS